MFDVEVASGLGGFPHECLDRVASAEWFEFLVWQSPKKLQFFGVSAHCPSQSSCPRRERRKPLLRIRASIAAVAHVKDTLVRCPSSNVVKVAALAVINGVLRGRAGGFEHSTQQRDFPVVLPH